VTYNRRARSRSARRAPSLGLESLESRTLLSTASRGFVVLPQPVSALVGPAAGGGASHARRPAPRSHGPAATPGVKARPLANGGAGVPYMPVQVRHAYGIDQLSQNGAGQVIAIVDAYDDPTIAGDLHRFDQQFGLPDPPLLKAVPKSGVPAYNAGWASEIALDVEWAHAVAPKATILLVEAASASVSDLMAGVDFAVAYGAKQVSMSWGGSSSLAASYDAHFRHPGVTFLAASGDGGAGVEYPATSPYVTAVGGTSLRLDANANRATEVAWAGSGGGTTRYEARPAYQSGFLSGTYRGTPDVAYNADPNTGYFVYDSSSGGAWFQVGGTSAGAPQWAGLVALANQGRAARGAPPLGTGLTFGTNQVLYLLAGGASYTNARGDFADIVSGSNGYPASRGYDLATGLGSPVANRLIPDLINA
jgi:subtilase family serine protease